MASRLRQGFRGVLRLAPRPGAIAAHHLHRNSDRNLTLSAPKGWARATRLFLRRSMPNRPNRRPVAIANAQISTLVLNVNTGCSPSCTFCYKEHLVTFAMRAPISLLHCACPDRTARFTALMPAMWRTYDYETSALRPQSGRSNWTAP
jgi:hypothetical protein